MPGVDRHSRQSAGTEMEGWKLQGRELSEGRGGSGNPVDRVHLACFEAAGRSVAFDVGCVREVVRGQPLAPLPGAPDGIEGVADLRGAVLPVLDLGRVLYGETCSGGARSRIAIVELEGLRVGVRVDSALEMLTVAPDAIEATDALAGCAEEDPVCGLVRREGAAPLVVVALERLLHAVARRAPAAEGTA